MGDGSQKGSGQPRPDPAAGRGSSGVRRNASLTPARQLAQQILVRVAEDGARATPLLDAAARRSALAPADVAWLTELVYGTLRHGSTLEGRLQRYLRAPFAQLPVDVQCALRAGAYQLLYMRAPAYAAVDAAVQLLRARFGALAGVSNAVLRRVAEEAAAEAANPREAATDAESLAAAHAHPPWLVARWLEQLGLAATQKLLQANNERPPLSLRVNLCRTSRDGLLARLREANLDAAASPHLPEGILLHRAGAVRRLPGYAEGHFTVQDAAPALVAHLLDPPDGATAVDLCAAPGGKATHLAELVGPRGRVFAVDAHPGRLNLVVDNADRLGHGQLVPVLADAAHGQGLEAALLAADGPGAGQADYVLVDPPCSGTGTLRRHPELRATLTGPSAQLLELQAALLDTAVELLAPGGRLVYAVCSLLEEEGEAMVQQLLSYRTDVVREPLPAHLGAYAAPGGPKGGPWALQTWPHLHGLDGFYAAVLRRKDRRQRR